jgi:hypothetical protein
VGVGKDSLTRPHHNPSGHRRILGAQWTLGLALPLNECGLSGLDHCRSVWAGWAGWAGWEGQSVGDTRPACAEDAFHLDDVCWLRRDRIRSDQIDQPEFVELVGACADAFEIGRKAWRSDLWKGSHGGFDREET